MPSGSEKLMYLAWVSRSSSTPWLRPPAASQSLCWLRGTSVLRKRRVFRTDVPSRVGGRRGTIASPFVRIGRSLRSFPRPNEVGRRRGTLQPFFVVLFPNRTGTFQFIRLSGPCFRNDAVDVPVCIFSWHLRHTTNVLRRRVAICLTQTGFSLRPGFSRSANLRI